ncbi:tetratricopeptide repeat protein [Micromonospora tulbaghiae]|uniref:tetratricopeptide repeat protein n=1 Tax=Micromonospora tulbaghiae TaxID=479978 RepID=UPI00342E4426
MAHYEQALPILREVGDRAGEAATLNNIGAVYDGLGDRQQALTYYEQALPITREVGDRAGEAITRYNIAKIHWAHDNLDQAVSELERVVDLDRQVEHPDLASDTAFLEQVRQERAAGNSVARLDAVEDRREAGPPPRWGRAATAVRSPRPRAGGDNV